MILTSETKGEAFPNLIPIFSNSVVSCIVCFAAGIIVTVILLCCVKNIIKSIEDGVMKVSILGAMACLIISIFFKEVDKSINILSFFCSFVFSWLLTKKSSKEEFKEAQQNIAKTSYRHIRDVRKATLVTKNRLIELKKKGELTQNDIDGILDNVEIILQCIKTNEYDWKDMVSDTYLSQEKSDIDPEVENASEKEEESQGSPDPDEVAKSVGKQLGKAVGKEQQ